MSTDSNVEVAKGVIELKAFNIYLNGSANHFYTENGNLMHKELTDDDIDLQYHTNHNGSIVNDVEPFKNLCIGYPKLILYCEVGDKVNSYFIQVIAKPTNISFNNDNILISIPGSSNDYVLRHNNIN